MKRWLFIAVLLIGCGHNGAVRLSANMESYLGKKDSELYSKWGAPSTSVRSADGKTISTWKEYRISSDKDHSIMDSCSKTFTIGGDGVIEAWYHDCVTVLQHLLASDLKTSGKLENR